MNLFQLLTTKNETMYLLEDMDLSSAMDKLRASGYGGSPASSMAGKEKALRREQVLGSQQRTSRAISSAFLFKCGAAAAAGDGDLPLAPGDAELLTAVGTLKVTVFPVLVDGAAQPEPLDGGTGDF